MNQDQNFVGQVSPPPVTSNTMQNNSLPGVGSLLKEGLRRLGSSWKQILSLEFIGWIPLIMGVLILLFVVAPAARQAVNDAPGVNKEVSYPINLKGGELNIAEQPQIRANVPFSALPAQARTFMIMAYVFIGLALVVRVAVWTGQIYVLGNEPTPSLGSAFSHGWRRWFPVVGHVIALWLISIPLMILVALPFLGLAIGGFLLLFAGPEVKQLLTTVSMIGGLFLLVVVPLYIFIWVRLAFVLPLAALGEGKGTFSRSWQITKGRFWPVFGRLLVFMLITLAILIPLQLLVGGVNLLGMGQAPVASAVGGIFVLVVQFLMGLYALSYTVTLLRKAEQNHSENTGEGKSAMLIITLISLILLVLLGVTGFVVFNKVKSAAQSSGLIRPVTTGEEQVQPSQQPASVQLPAVTQPTLGERYTDKNNNYSIQPPEGWQQGGQDPLTIFSSAPLEGSVKAQLDVAPLGNFPDLDKAVSYLKETLSQDKTSRLIDDARIKTATGKEAHILGQITEKTGITIRGKLILVKDRENVVWLAGLFAPNSVWDAQNFGVLSDMVLTSFEPK